MNLDYAEIFGQRGGAYHGAMQRFPQARRREFSALFDRAPAPGALVLDIPAGGGYLQTQLPQATTLPLELAAGFSDRVPVVASTGDWPVPPADHAVCLAALHHVPDQPAFLRNVCRHLKRGAVLHIADVVADSDVSRFLDGFVDKWNGQGHEGRYLDPAHPVWEGLGQVVRCERVSCPWEFSSTDAMLAFTTQLFDLRECPPEVLAQTLRQDLGISRIGSAVLLHWSLLYVDILVGT